MCIHTYIHTYIYIYKKVSGIFSVSLFDDQGVICFHCFSSSSFLRIGEFLRKARSCLPWNLLPDCASLTVDFSFSKICSELPWIPRIWYPVRLRLSSIPLCSSNRLLTYSAFLTIFYHLSRFYSDCCLYAASWLVIYHVFIWTPSYQ